MKRTLLVLAACGGHVPAPVPLTTTATFQVGMVDGIVEQGDITYLFGSDKLVIARGERATTVVPTSGDGWSSVASIVAPDGEGRWVVAVRDHELWRIRLDGEVENISQRFGLGDEAITQVAAAGPTIAIAFRRGLVVTRDGVHLQRYATTGTIAVARDRVAIATTHPPSTASLIELWDLRAGTSRTFAVVGLPMFVGADSSDPRLVVAGASLWVERSGRLARVPITDPYQAAAAGARLWVNTAAQLYFLAGATLARAALPAALHGTSTAVFGSPNGDVWLEPGARVEALAVQRYSLDRNVLDPQWHAEVQPVFDRVCAHCHLPGGDADVDLSTPAAWATEHDEIVRRVLVTRTMPPAGTTLTDADRDALAAWLHAR